jgi:hypothetical protein
MDAPSSAINTAEAESGIARTAAEVATLHCSLGFGLGVRKQGSGAAQDFGQVLTTARAPDGTGRGLDAVCGGLALLNSLNGAEAISALSTADASALLEELVQSAGQNADLQEAFGERGRLAAENMSLVMELLRPGVLLLGGPMAQVPAYAEGFREGLAAQIAGNWPLPDIRISTMTPTGASRWLALRATVAMGHFDLAPLKEEDSA